MPLADGLWKVRSVSYVGAVRARWVFSTKFVVELHDLPHQPFDQVLAKNAILARGQFGHGLRDGLNHFIRCRPCLTRPGQANILPRSRRSVRLSYSGGRVGLVRFPVLP